MCVTDAALGSQCAACVLCGFGSSLVWRWNMCPPRSVNIARVLIYILIYFVHYWFTIYSHVWYKGLAAFTWVLLLFIQTLKSPVFNIGSLTWWGVEDADMRGDAGSIILSPNQRVRKSYLRIWQKLHFLLCVALNPFLWYCIPDLLELKFCGLNVIRCLVY